MAITLEEAKKNVQDDLQMGVIDEFQKPILFWNIFRLTMQYLQQAVGQHQVTVM